MIKNNFNYIERFVIPGLSDFLISENVGGFYVWYGGCAIGGTMKSVTAARIYIHDYAKTRIGVRISELNNILKTLNQSQTALGADVFRLGKFLTNL